MFVYLKSGNTVQKIPDVTIQDCYKPQVGECVEDRIDPALWYKVLVLKAVFVDCDQRCVYWTISDDKASKEFYEYEEKNIEKDRVLAFFHATERMLVEDCYDFDPNIDELFDTARRVFDTWQSNSQDLDPQENLLKMLHVYILPKVKFAQCHCNQIRNVLELIEKHHDAIEDKIQKKDMTKKNTELSLKKQRERILKNEDFSRTSYIATLNEKFLKVFLQHLEKDIRKMNDEFVSHGSEVEQLRGSLKKKEVEELTERRVRRDSIYDELQKAIAAREEIKNVICRNHVTSKKFSKKSKRRSTHTVFHEVYMEVASRLQGMSKDIQNLINIKIKLSSVREAVLLSVKELETDGETYGYNRKKGTFEIETDLYDPHNKPEEWATLEEKVKMFLKAKQLGVRSKFEKFCATVKDKCQRLFDDSKLFTISLSETPHESQSVDPPSPSTAKTLSILGVSSQSRRSGYIQPNYSRSERTGSSTGRPVPESRQFRKKFAATYTSRWSFGTIPKDSCEAICHDVIEHLTQMATELAVEIKRGQPEIPRSFIWKTYICYEEHVSSQLMPVLNELYEHSYKEKCDSLSRWIATTPMSEFGFSEHIMANFLQLASSASSSENTSREPSSDIEEELNQDAVMRHPKSEFMNSLSNKSIKDMTLEQLYNYCDAQSEDLPPMYEGIIGTDTDVNGADGSDDNFDASETHAKELFVNRETIPKKSVPNGIEIGEECQMRREVNESFVIIPDPNPTQSVQSDNSLYPADNDLTDSSYVEVTLRPKPNTCHSPPTHSSVMPVTIKQFSEQFKDFEKFIRDEDSACTLFKKLRTLTQALKYIETQITEMKKSSGTEIQVCSDDLLDIIIMLLCQIDPDLLLKLYSHMNLLMHLRPNFMEGSAHDYALITFCGAFQHLFEQKVLSKNVTNF